MRQLDPLFAGYIHDVDILRAGSTGAVVANPGKSQELTVGRPRWRDCVTLVSESLNVGSIGIHHINLREAGAAAHESDLRVRLRIPHGRYIRTLAVGQLLQSVSILVGGIDVGKA